MADFMNPSADLLAGMEAGRDEMRDEIEQLHARIAELEAIVDKLPQTADGVVVIPHLDIVWVWDERGKRPLQYMAVWTIEPELQELQITPDDPLWSRCYFTPLAAEQAAKKEAGR